MTAGQLIDMSSHMKHGQLKRNRLLSAALQGRGVLFEDCYQAASKALSYGLSNGLLQEDVPPPRDQVQTLLRFGDGHRQTPFVHGGRLAAYRHAQEERPMNTGSGKRRTDVGLSGDA